MTILNADYIITMPDDSKWKVQVSTIANHRIKHYEHKGYQAAFDETASLFESHHVMK